MSAHKKKKSLQFLYKFACLVIDYSMFYDNLYTFLMQNDMCVCMCVCVCVCVCVLGNNKNNNSRFSPVLPLCGRHTYALCARNERFSQYVLACDGGSGGGGGGGGGGGD